MSQLIELHVESFDEIKEYYLKLGFDVEWERIPDGFKGYLVMKFEDNILCFWGGNEKIYEQEYFKHFPKNTPRGYGVELVLMVGDIEEFYNEHRQHANVVEDLTLQPWGLKDFRAVDPAGYYLRFTSRHDILDSRFAVK